MRVKQSRQSATRLGAAVSAVALAVAGLGALGGPASADDTGGLSLSTSQPTKASTVTADKAPSSSLARTPASLKKLTSAKPIPVMIKYDYDAVASYAGALSGYAATSPSVTERSLSAKSGAKSRYLDFLRTRESKITSRVQAAVPSAKVTGSYKIVYGGVAATIPGNSVNELLAVPGVVAVQRDSLNQLLTDSSTTFVNADAAYRTLRTTRNAGKGILYGNLDSGVWPEHPSFADQGNLPAYTGPALPCDFGEDPTTLANDPFVCNNKLVGGASFMEVYDSQNGTDYDYQGTARDPEGHGSHTASTSAGNVVNDVHTIGPVLARINGMAPGAQIMEYRVCGPAGCYGSDSAAAVQQAILDGVKVINFSISGGTSPMTDPVELAFLDAYNAGVFVAASAGNDGPGAGTANHLSPWVTTVAASTQTREFASDLTLTADDASTFQVSGASVTAGAGPLPIAVAADAGDRYCLDDTPAAGLYAGKIVVCERGGGGLGRVSKGFNVLQGGAVGMILYNPVQADVETDNHWLPTVHVADGTDLLAYIGSHTGITASFTAGAARDGKGDVMAAFSSRGPAGAFVKPDITAPGVQILAAMTPTPESIVNGPPGQYYQAIAGTSMSSPHVAGAAILVAAVHPNWTPGQIKSALMTQSVTKVVKEDEVTPADAFDMGAGRLNVGAANKAPLTISETAANFALLTGDPLHAVDLNIPSINAPVMPGRLTTVRTVKNVSGKRITVNASAADDGNTSITFSPRSRTLAPGASGSFSITINSTAPEGEQQFATVYFKTGATGQLHLPVAFVPGQGVVGLEQGCDATSIPLNSTTTCTVTATNTGFEEQEVDLTTSVNSNLRIVGANGATVSGGRASTSATLSAAEQGVPSVGPGLAPAGYLPLELFGIAPDPIGDEEIINYNVPGFNYNGITYDTIGVDSNGYAVVGGGSSADNNCCNLPGGPSPAPPNNVLAPFWSDLDGSAAEGIRAGVLTDGVSSWLIIEWEVNVFGTADTRSFQTWIGVNGTQDISFTYSAAQASPGGQPFLVGAENASGDGDMEAVLPTGDDLVVTSSDPTPGGSVSYTVTVRGIKKGAGNVHTDMDATGVSGTTTANTPVIVQ
ncbi:Serine protease, subtilase family protein [metagenome]|uniref:Serine protease, subtilase family protein n=1 Tax=metagenome TaxID=256318 RepID=A0A2P2CDJ0_9ZZZZ